eukprot:TRINITY_DN5195_c0_g1_i1.p1 TRINITY_DN5195_c0_g1~~TRINITY_DN5195_c0_g1_i1.p1  ORF type:complete len:425 (-),score=193.74 TRINITY_DN5195_c0_g1_i1:216-1460(-)
MSKKENNLEQVTLTVIEARNLAAMSRSGTSDPYVKVSNNFSKQVFKTKYIPKTLNPVWNQEFNFLEADPNGVLILKIWDRDFWFRDDFLGEVEIKLDRFSSGKPTDFWEKLTKEPKKKKGKEAAEIHLKITAVCKGGPSAGPSGEKSAGAAGPRRFADCYTLGKTLGRGGFAVVREAMGNQTKEMYAIKIIEKKGLKEKDMEVLRREVAIMEKLSHPGIVQLIEVFDEPEVVALVLELVKGGELFDKIVERGFYSEKDAADLIKQILTAVEYMHSNGITHRDLKPENLLCSGDKIEKIKIADFGLSKEGDTLQTSCGSPGYVAPEILLGEEYDNSVDVWSVGVIAYVLLCGYPPFFSDNPGELCQQIISVKYDFPDAEWSEVSDAAKDFIQKILVQNPSQRLTAAEALNHKWIV